MAIIDDENPQEIISEPKILIWDTEFTPLVAYTWSLWPKSIPTNMVIDTQRILCWGAQWYGKKQVLTGAEWVDGRGQMLQRLHDLLNEADFVISWNGDKFDTKMVNREFLREGLTPVAPYKQIDLMVTARQKFKFASNKLDHVAQELGIGQKLSHSGFDMWRGVMAGDLKAQREMLKYQRQDVRLLVPMYEKLKPWIKMSHPVSYVIGSCHNCGSTDLQRRGYSKTLTGLYQRYACLGCGAWHRGTKRFQVTELRSHHS